MVGQSALSMAAYAKSVNFKNGYQKNLMEYKHAILAYFITGYDVSNNASFKNHIFNTKFAR